MGKKHKNVCTTLNYNERFPTLASTITGYISMSAFTSLLGILTGITSFVIGLKICSIAAGIKKYTSITKKKKNNHDNIVLLWKSKLKSIEFLRLQSINISHDEFVLLNNVLLKEYDDMKEE